LIKKIALSTLLASTLVVAAEPDLKKDDAFVTHTELGYIETQGNTETKTFNLDAKVKKGWGRNIFELHFDGQYASDKEIETKNKYLLELEYDYEITDRLAFDYLLGYKTDKFSSFDYQFYTGPGAKYKAIVSTKHNLSVEGNILYAVDEISAIYYNGTDVIQYPASTAGATSKVNSSTDNYAAYRAKGVYTWQMLENLKFDQELSYRGSFEDFDKHFIFSKSALTSKFSDMFSASLSYKVDYVNEPADAKENTDTTLTLNLIVDY
jgi:putative salt-induced outer membrane protein